MLPRLQGRAQLIRYADDLVVVCEREDEARKVMDVLPKRFGRFGLTLHPDKTRLVRFVRPAANNTLPWYSRCVGTAGTMGSSGTLKVSAVSIKTYCARVASGLIAAPSALA